MKYLEPAAMILATACAFGSGFLICPRAEAQTLEPEGRREAVTCEVRVDGQRVPTQGCPKISWDETMQEITFRITLGHWNKNPNIIKLGEEYTVGVLLQIPYRDDVMDTLFRGVEIRGRCVQVEVQDFGKAGDFVQIRMVNTWQTSD